MGRVTRYTDDIEAFEYWNEKEGAGNSLRVFAPSQDAFRVGLNDLEGNGTVMSEEESHEAQEYDVSQTRVSWYDKAEIKEYLGKNGFHA